VLRFPVSGLAAFCVTALLTTGARAGNDEGILAGGHAAITAGAITATVGDGSAAWYNPAGIARIKDQTLDINASVYGVSLLKAAPFVTFGGNEAAEAKTTDWQLIPSVLSYSRQLSTRLVAAFAIVIPKTTDYDLRTHIDESDGTRWDLGVDTLRNEYDYILSFGWRLSPDLRIGLSVHGIYISTEQMVQVGRGQPGVEDAAFQTYSSHSKLGDYGLRLGLGMQWTVTPQFELGLAIQTYTLTGFRSTLKTSFSSRFGSTEEAQGTFSSLNEDKLKSVWELSTPLAVRFGGAYRFGPAQIMLDGSVYTPLQSEERDLDRKLTGNARLACMVELSEKLSFGVGAFTDLSGSKSTASTNFAGVAGGVRLAQHYHIREGNRSLTFLTTLAVRYAYGWGRGVGVKFEGEGNSNFTLTDVPLTAHEMGFNLGGGVSF
jgi:urease beta subunit